MSQTQNTSGSLISTLDVYFDKFLYPFLFLYFSLSLFLSSSLSLSLSLSHSISLSVSLYPSLCLSLSVSLSLSLSFSFSLRSLFYNQLAMDYLLYCLIISLFSISLSYSFGFQVFSFILDLLHLSSEKSPGNLPPIKDAHKRAL